MGRNTLLRIQTYIYLNPYTLPLTFSRPNKYPCSFVYIQGSFFDCLISNSTKGIDHAYRHSIFS
jgi:hypothetical protein